MFKNIFCLGVNTQFDLPFDEQIRLMQQSGFDAFFTPWDYNFKMDDFAVLAEETGMIYQSVHAPFGKVADMWHGSPAQQEAAVDELVACVRDCAKHGVNIMVSHVFIGFDRQYAPNEQGLENFARVIDEAEELGVRIAFENTEGLEYLEAIFNAFPNSRSVRFCLDTRHEMCYNHPHNLIERYGDRLIATHINDNLGIRSRRGEITWLDDLHLLPFDGIRNWDETARELDECGYKGILTFELNRISKPGRHENDIYGKMEIEEFFAEAYKRACRFAAKRKAGNYR